MNFNQSSTLPKQFPITIIRQIATLGKHNRHLKLMRQEPSPTDANKVPNKRQEHNKQQVVKENTPEELCYKEFETYEPTFLFEICFLKA